MHTKLNRISVGSLIQVYMNDNYLPLPDDKGAALTEDGYPRMHKAILVGFLTSYVGTCYALGFDPHITGDQNLLHVPRFTGFERADMMKGGWVYSQEAMDRATRRWFLDVNNSCQVFVIREAFSRKLNTHNLLGITTSTPAAPKVIPVDKDEDPSTNWRAWQNSRPGECPCGINRNACAYHR